MQQHPGLFLSCGPICIICNQPVSRFPAVILCTITLSNAAGSFETGCTITILNILLYIYCIESALILQECKHTFCIKSLIIVIFKFPGKIENMNEKWVESTPEPRIYHYSRQPNLQNHLLLFCVGCHCKISVKILEQNIYISAPKLYLKPYKT